MAGYAGYLDYSLDAVNRGQGREGCEREGGDRGKCVNAYTEDPLQQRCDHCQCGARCLCAAAGDGEQLFRESSNDPHPPLIYSQTWTLGCGNLDIGAFGAQGAVLNFSPPSK